MLGLGVEINIEVKTPKFEENKPRFAPLRIPLVEKMHEFLVGKERNAIVSSFDHEFLAQLREYQSNVLMTEESQS